jgi:uncharacterized protein (DUF3820 family)
MPAPENIDANDLAALMRADLDEIERMHMPFGKYGPGAFPPEGVPLYDLPAEYLSWFAHKPNGWPKGKLGRLMEIVFNMKADGSDIIFDPMRKRAGGRTTLRAVKTRSFQFGEG